MSAKYLIPPGTRFTRLVVTDTPNELRLSGNWMRRFIECRCDCGMVKWIRKGDLTSGDTKSCGCHRSAVTTARSTRHGFASRHNKSRTYKCWEDMLQRCTNPKSSGFKYYGGRGICIDPRWNEFSNFLSDMGEAPDTFTIERNDVNGHYTKSNCRWIPMSEQSQNRRMCIVLTAFGTTACMSVLSRKFNIPNLTVWHRIKAGAHPECAFTKKGRLTKGHILTCLKCRKIQPTLTKVGA